MAVGGTLALLLYKAIFGHQESVLVILALGAITFIVGLQFVVWTFVASALKQIMRRDTFERREMIREIHGVTASPLNEGKTNG
jgi:dihydrodipicolinate synthase/N-acetylneuraminate lyase